MQVGDLVKYVTRGDKEVVALILEADVDYVRCTFTVDSRNVEGWLDRNVVEVISESR